MTLIAAWTDRTWIMNVPTKEQCYNFIKEMGMLSHIVAHSEQVCRVALCLSSHLSARGIPMNHELIRAAAMLHDITKTRSFKTKENHAETGGKYLSEKGFPEVGHIVAQHVRLDSYFASQEPMEAEIVNYADKRVLHDKIASLSVRMGYILEKYGKNPTHNRQIKRLWEKSKALEVRLFAYVSFLPDQLKQMVEIDHSANSESSFSRAGDPL
jgi:putative nucleotidyltransferase with HDIG domain